MKEIAKRDKAKVIPTGATAANRLEFSTQVPMNTIFLTTGSGRKMKLGNRTVTLKYGVPKNFAFRGCLMPELVQALRSIGEHNITQDVEARIGQLFTETPETDTEVLEWLIYCGYSIIVVNQNEKACSVFFDWWHKLGYEPEEIDRVVKETEAICNKMRQIINL